MHREASQLAAHLDDKMQRQAAELRRAAEAYADAEQRNMTLIRSLSGGMDWGGAGYQTPLGGIGLADLKMQAEAGLHRLKPLPSMDLLEQDPLVRSMREAAADLKRAPEDREAAQAELDKMFQLRLDIAKAQTAYQVYKAYGNQGLMDAMHEMAEAARKELKVQGVREAAYGDNVDLTPYFRRAAIEACDFDPLCMAQPMPLPLNPKYRLLLSLGVQEGIMRDWARTELTRLSAIEPSLQSAEDMQQKELQEKVEAYAKSMLPPTHLSDGTLITAANKENELTFAYFNEHVLEKDKEYMNVQVPYTAYVAWIRTIYGRNGWEQAMHLSEEFVLGLGTEVITSVIDMGELVVEFVIDPAQTTREAIEAVKQTAGSVAYFVENPDKLVDVAKQVYADFEQMSPEEKARALGAISTILIPGAAITKVTKAGKVVEGITTLTKKAGGAVPTGLDRISLGPVPVTAGPRMPTDLSPGWDIGALPRTPVQDNYLRQMEISRSELADLAAGNKGNADVKGADSDRFLKVEGMDADDAPSAFKQTKFASSYEARLHQTPSPNNKTVGFEGQRGESKCILKPPPDPELKKILDEAGINGINYKIGVPDFSPVAKAELEIDHMVGGVGSNGTKARTANFKQADIKFAEQLNNSPELASQFGLTPGKIKAGDIADVREELKLTWHELNDGKTIQLVPSEINSKFGHLGGVGEINAGAFEPGGFADN